MTENPTNPREDMAASPAPAPSPLSRFDRLSLVIQTLTALAVVFSVIYLAVQVRQNTATTRTTTSIGAYQMLQNIQEWVMMSPDMADIQLRGDSAYESLEGVERLKYTILANSNFNLWEFGYTSNLAGTVDPGLWAALDAGYRGYICIESLRMFWSGGRIAYEEGFRTYVDDLIARKDEVCPEDAEADTTAADSLSQ